MELGTRWRMEYLLELPRTTTDTYPKIVSRQVGFWDDCTLEYLAGLLNAEEDVGEIDKEGFTSVSLLC